MQIEKTIETEKDMEEWRKMSTQKPHCKFDIFGIKDSYSVDKLAATDMSQTRRRHLQHLKVPAAW